MNKRHGLLSAALMILSATSPIDALHAATVVTVNATQIFGTIDPAKVNDYTEYMAGVNLYDGLTTLDGDGNITPLLAESWDVSDDALRYTVTAQVGTASAPADGSNARPANASDSTVITLRPCFFAVET